MEAILHFIGICPDTMSHIDLLDIAAGGGLPALYFIKMKFGIIVESVGKWINL